ncbi:Alpha/Beta hydrolase protein [Ilyonectria sp. MPI-CAGE-AT-0026]|nr:Alpha/Beta hydrolase protein [Ilyonectria sp. MPI-CAGE-AT-0026]
MTGNTHFVALVHVVQGVRSIHIQDIADDAENPVRWVHKNLANRVIIAGSSAGGYLALLAAAQARSLKPVAVLSVYGLNNLATESYITPGSTMAGVPIIPNLDEVIGDIKSAANGGQSMSGYPFPEKNDKRMGWIAALHEAALYPDIVCGVPGLAKTIRSDGVQSIPNEIRKFFPLEFGLDGDFPPTALLYGDQDSSINAAQSVLAAERLRSAGIKTCLEVVPGKGHGFDAMEVAAGVDFEAESETGVFAGHLKSIISFLDGVIGR